MKLVVKNMNIWGTKFGECVQNLTHFSFIVTMLSEISFSAIYKFPFLYDHN